MQCSLFGALVLLRVVVVLILIFLRSTNCSLRCAAYLDCISSVHIERISFISFAANESCTRCFNDFCIFNDKQFQWKSKLYFYIYFLLALIYLCNIKLFFLMRFFFNRQLIFPIDYFFFFSLSTQTIIESLFDELFYVFGIFSMASRTNWKPWAAVWKI